MKRVVLAILLAAGAAHADPDSDAKAHAVADEGVALFQANDFAGAAQKFKDAYELNHDPSYLFNVAQAYRHAGDCVAAADFYGRFLADVPHPPNEDKIRAWYAAQTECAKEKSASPPVEPAKPVEAPPPPRPAPPPPPPATSPAPSPLPQQRGHVGLGIGITATGVVALAVGGFFAWDAHFLSGRRAAYLAPCTTDDRCSSAVVDDYDRRGSRARTFAIVGFATGGVAIAAGAVLYLMSSTKTETPFAVAPVRGGAVVGLTTAW